MLALDPRDHREGGLHRQPVRRRAVDPGRHRIEKYAGKRRPKTSVAELAQALLAGLASRANEQLPGYAQFLRPGQQVALEERPRRFGQRMQPVRVDEPPARSRRAAQQAVREAGVADELQTVRLVG